MYPTGSHLLFKPLATVQCPLTCYHIVTVLAAVLSKRCLEHACYRILQLHNICFFFCKNASGFSYMICFMGQMVLSDEVFTYHSYGMWNFRNLKSGCLISLCFGVRTGNRARRDCKSSL